MVSGRTGSGRDPRLVSTGEQAQALAALPDPVYILRPVSGPDGEVSELICEYANPAAAALHRMPVESVIGRGDKELFPWLADLSMWGHIREAIDTGKPVSWAIDLEDEGAESTFRVTAAVFDDGLLLFTSNDLTEHTADKRILRATMDSLLDPHVRLDPIRDENGQIVDFVYADANPAACAYNGLAYEDLVGARLLDVQPGSIGTGLLDKYRQVVETGEPLVQDDFVYAQELAGGEERHYDVRAAPTDGGLSFTWRDVTERHLAAEHDRRMATIVENSHDAIIGTVQQDVIIVSWNPAAERMYGYTAEEMVGRSVYVLSPGGVAPESEGLAARLAEGESFTDFEALRLRKDGSEITVSVSVSAIRDDDGQVTGFVTVHRDITAQVEARREKEAQTAREQQRLAELERFERLTVGRELRMIELKREIELLRRAGPPSGGHAGDKS